MWFTRFAVKVRSVFILSVLFFSLFQLSHADNLFVEDQILLRFQLHVSPSDINNFEAVSGLKLLREIGHLRVKCYQLPATLSVAEAIKKYHGHYLIEWVEPNFYHSRQALPISSTMPTDPMFANQWSLHNSGHEVNGIVGKIDADIDWVEANALFSGTTEVIVAVIDSGIALDHPEINDNLWVNSAEAQGQSGVDDDDNGYVDDINGWDFFDNDPYPFDEDGHGTLVASLIGGVAGNQEGGVGISSHIKLMPIRVLGDLGFKASSAAFLFSTQYAMENGARIINYSIASGGYSYFEELHVQWLADQGILLVVPAGNGGGDAVGDDIDSVYSVYPASYDTPSVIAVAASDQNDELVRFSNYGASSVDLVAPGNNIFGADTSRSVFFEEDFDDLASFDGWSKGGADRALNQYEWSFLNDGETTWMSDSVVMLDEETNTVFDVDYLNNTQSWLVTPRIDLAGRLGPRLHYTVLHGLAQGDFLSISITKDDGETWVNEGVIYGYSFGAVQYSLDLSPYEGESIRVQFMLYTNSRIVDKGVHIDKVSLSQVDTLNSENREYQYNSGTSFAVPLVSGVAAMLLSQQPELSLQKLRALLLGNVDSLVSLKQKVVSGGRLNAYKSLCAAISCKPFTVSLTSSEQLVNEDDGVLQFTVVRTGDLDSALTVGIGVDAISAVLGEDFSLSHNEVIFAPQETEKTVEIILVDDLLEEDTEIFTVSLQPQYGDIGEIGSTTVSILDVDIESPPNIQFVADFVTLRESDGKIVVSVSRDGELARAAKVSYAFVNKPKRIVIVTGSLEFAENEAIKTLNIYVKDDELYSENESFSLSLTTPVRAVIGEKSMLEVKIIEDDAPPSVVDDPVAEGGAEPVNEVNRNASVKSSGGGGAMLWLCLICVWFAWISRRNVRCW